MNINKVIKKVKDEIGLSRYLNLGYSDHDIYNIIKTVVIPEWGALFRQEFEPYPFYLDGQHRLGPDLFTIPKEITDVVKRSGLEIVDIKSMRFSNTTNMNNTLAAQSIYHQASQSLDTMVANYNTISQYNGIDIFTRMLTSAYLEKPNKIRFNFTTSAQLGVPIQAAFWLTQSPNLYGIIHGRELEFQELCKLNIMTVIYENSGKYIESIQSGMGNINLKLEDWQNAKNKKDELITKLANESSIVSGMASVRVQ